MGVARDFERPQVWPEFRQARILLVDDDEDATFLLSRALKRAGCSHVLTADNPARALGIYQKHRPDLVVMDLHLGPADGITLMERLRQCEDAQYTAPVLLVTANSDEEVKRDALERGVSDFLAKHSDTTEFVLRVRNLLNLNGLRREIERQKEDLEETVRRRTQELSSARHEVLERLAIAAEY